MADPNEPTLWLKTLSEIFPNDPEAIRLLRQWFGYCLTQDVSEQKILVMIGPKRAGKGLSCNVLREIIGEHNFASTFLPALGTQFGLDGLLGKSVLLIPEAKSPNEFTKGITASILKSISGGDPVRIERKHEHSLTMALPIKIVIVSNDMLDFNDESGTIFSRFLPLHFQQSFYGAEDKRRFEKLQKELSGIVAWALQGLHDLRENGFAEPTSGEDLRAALSLHNNPALTFIDECLKADARAKPVPVNELFGHFAEWCGDLGIPPSTMKQFREQVGNKFSKKQHGTSRRMHYFGARLIPPLPSPASQSTATEF